MAPRCTWDNGILLQVYLTSRPSGSDHAKARIFYQGKLFDLSCVPCIVLIRGCVFVILRVDINEPGIKLPNANSGTRGEQAGSHGVILIVVLEHTRTADRQ